MQGCVEQLAGAAGVVTGEDAARAVAAVGGRREPDEQEPRRGIAEAGHRPSPVDVVAMPRDLRACHLLAPFDQSWAAPTGRDVRDHVPQAPVGRSDRRTHPGWVGGSIRDSGEPVTVVASGGPRDSSGAAGTS